MSKFICVGDPHLGASTSIGRVGSGQSLNSRVEDQLNLLDWCLEQAIEISAQIIITGDIFEEPKPSPSLITLFVSWLKKCQANKIHVHLIMGNHDTLRTGNIYSSPLDIISEVEFDNVDVYKDLTTVIFDKMCITMMPFRDRKSLGAVSNAEAVSILKNNIMYELAGMPSSYDKILIGHLVLEGAIPVGDEIDDITNELHCPLDMFNGYDYVWMGHVHKPQVLKTKNPHIAHVGSMDISNFGETDQQKIIVIYDADDPQKFITRHVPTRTLKKISITIPNDIENSTEYVIQQIKNTQSNFSKAIIKVELSLPPEMKSVDKSKIEKLLIERGAFNVCNISESKKNNIIKKDIINTLNTKMDPVSAIKRYSELYVEEESKSDFIQLAMEIYNSFKTESKE